MLCPVGSQANSKVNAQHVGSQANFKVNALHVGSQVSSMVNAWKPSWPFFQQIAKYCCLAVIVYCNRFVKKLMRNTCHDVPLTIMRQEELPILEGSTWDAKTSIWYCTWMLSTCLNCSGKSSLCSYFCFSVMILNKYALASICQFMLLCIAWLVLIVWFCFIVRSQKALCLACSKTIHSMMENPHLKSQRVKMSHLDLLKAWMIGTLARHGLMVCCLILTYCWFLFVSVQCGEGSMTWVCRYITAVLWSPYQERWWRYIICFVKFLYQLEKTSYSIFS